MDADVLLQGETLTEYVEHGNRKQAEEKGQEKEEEGKAGVA